MEYTFDKIIYDNIVICQPKKDGFRFGCDSPILAWFTKAKKKWSIIDIGSGSGVISALIAAGYGCNITAVELQQEMYQCLINTIEASNLKDKITPLLKDVKELSYNNYFDAVVCNPPYRHEHSGKVNLSLLEKNARFTYSMSIFDVAKFAKKGLKHGGRLFFSYDADMLIEGIEACSTYNLEPKRILFLHKNIHEKAKLVFVEAVLHGGRELTIEPALYQQGDLEIRKRYDQIFSKQWKV